MKQRGFFITGTDTGIGKTWVTTGLMNLLREEGFHVLGMKPVATGAVVSPCGLVNDDALQLQAMGSEKLDYADINPWVFEPPVSPHIAAALAGCELDPDKISDACRALAHKTDYLLVEGVGGWEVPLNQHQSVADLAVRLGFPVILVIGLRLGCLNHGLLTARAMARRSVSCVGWIANGIDADMLYPDCNVETLKTLIGWPLLATLPCLASDSGKNHAVFTPFERDQILRGLGGLR